MAATVVPSVIVNLKVLGKDSYKEWSFRVKTYLLAEDLWKVVTSQPPKEGQASFNDWSRDNAKALHTIHISCGDNAYAFIEDTSVAKYAWEILAIVFNPSVVSHDAGCSLDSLPSRSASDSNQTPTDGGDVLKKDMEIEEVEDVGSNLHTNQTPIDVDVEPKKDMKIETGEGGDSMNGNSMNGAFLEYVNDRKWDAVMEFIGRHPEAVRARHPSNGWTALHYAVMAEEVDIVKKLLTKMEKEDLEIKDSHGHTALASAVLKEDTENMVEIVKCLVEKNKKLLTIVDSDEAVPLLRAFLELKRKMATYIYSVTPLETLNDGDASLLICSGFIHKCFDIPLGLLRHNPSWGITKNRFGTSPFHVLSYARYAYLSGSRLKFWERWIYDWIHVEPTRAMDLKKEATTNIKDVCIDVQTQERSQGNQRHLICSVGHFFRGLVVTNLLQLVGIDRIYQMKLIHVQALEILDHICKELEPDRSLAPAIFRAVQLGQVEFITHIFKANPRFRSILDVDDRTLFQFAAECRQDKIFSLIYEFDERPNTILLNHDKFENMALHATGKFSSLAQIDHIRGAALQMQRELQWFKEVESISHPFAQEKANIDNLRPRELFTQSHKELVKEGEKSMKETATSCTVAGALIVTIMFASAFTVPGGNGDNGLPNFLDQKAFKIFIASDAISLFFSTTSVMIFLGILTSRYAEDDFLKSLPTKMILGLSTLFISIAAMMIAFFSALLLMLPGESWIALPSILLSTVPIASFVWMQFPLLVDIFISTYGAGPFDRKVQHWGSS